MITWILVLRIVTVFVCPQAATVTVQLEHVDASGSPSSDLHSRAATGSGSTAPVQETEPEPVQLGLYLDPYTIGRLIMCLSHGYCPHPGTPIEWGIPGN